MTSGKRVLCVAFAAAALGLGAAAPARADQGGAPNANSCGGIGSDQAFEGPFTCDDVGQGHAAAQASGPGQGFPPGTTG